jgi:hypothetical protein
MEYDDEDQVSQNYLLYRCSHLKCLSIMNATWSFPGSETSNPVTQEMLLKMVRHHPTLRWLQSDLTQENITMPQEEKPEITFVS